MVEEQYQRALNILEENKDKLEALAEKLLKSEVIFKEDLIAIFGKRPWDKEEVKPEVKEKTEENEPKNSESETTEEVVEQTQNESNETDHETDTETEEQTSEPN